MYELAQLRLLAFQSSKIDRKCPLGARVERYDYPEVDCILQSVPFTAESCKPFIGGPVEYIGCNGAVFSTLDIYAAMEQQSGLHIQTYSDRIHRKRCE
jgi:hypothetical protein